MTDLVTRAQIDMLAELLGTDAAQLRELERLGAHDLKALRERISDVLFDAMAPTFARVAKLAPLVPNQLAASVAVRAVPPEVGGRAGGAIGIDMPERAADLLGRLPPDYMADAAPYLDPRAIAVLAPRIPADALIPAANELLDRRDYTTTVRFVEHATDELIRAFERGIPDDVGLLRTAALTPSSDRLDSIVGVLPSARRDRIVVAGITGDDDAVLACLSVVSRLSASLAERAAEVLFDALDADGLDRVLGLAIAGGACAEVLDIAGGLSEAMLERLAGHCRFDDTAFAGAAATSPRRARALARLTT